jgi:putative transposase
VYSLFLHAFLHSTLSSRVRKIGRGSLIARDRTGEFEPQFIRKGQKRFGGFDTKIIATYAQGMTVREIKRFLEEQYKVEVSSDLISTVTVRSWRCHLVEKPAFGVDVPVVFFDALRVRIRDEGTVKNKAVYVPCASKGMGPRRCWAFG